MKRRTHKFYYGVTIMLLLAFCVGVFSPAGAEAAIPSKPSVSLVKRTKKTAKITVKKQSNVSGYQVWMKASKNGKYQLVMGIRTNSYTIKKLKANKTYYVRVRAFRTRGYRITFGKYSAAIKIKPYQAPVPKPSATPEPIQSADPNETPGPLETLDPNETPEPQETISPDETPRAPGPQVTMSPDETPEPLETPEPTVTPEPQRTPEPTETPEPTRTPGEDSTDMYALRVLELVNQERKTRGIAPLQLDQTLCQAAGVRVVEISSLFDHTRPDGTSCFSVLDEYGYSYMAAGENIATGQATPEAVVESWMNSAGHRANILSPTFSKLGVGYYHMTGGVSRYYWVQMFSD